MPRYAVSVKRQEPNSKSTIGTIITVEAESEFNARMAAEGIARARWPKCVIMVGEARKQ